MVQVRHVSDWSERITLDALTEQSSTSDGADCKDYLNFECKSLQM